VSGAVFAPTCKDRKRDHLRKADEISSVFDFKCRVSSAHFVALGKPNKLTYPRLVVMVAKKTSRRAVQRNYMRRVIREYFRKTKPETALIDIVIRVTKSFKNQENAAINEEIAVIFSKLVKCHAS